MSARVAMLVAALLVAPSALAQTKRECAAAYTEAQVLRSKQRLRDAKKQLAICADDACPQSLKKDCVPWLGEVEKALPSLVVQVTDSGGAPIAGAHVVVDDQAAFSGQATRIDPGEHSVSADATGFVTRTQTVKLDAGESRTLRVSLDAVAAAPATAVTKPSRAVPVAPIVVTVLGAAGLGVFAAFGVAGNSIKSDLDAQGCKPNCPASRVDAIKSDYVVADVALGVGLVALVVGTVLFFVIPWSDTAKTATSPGTFIVRF